MGEQKNWEGVGKVYARKIHNSWYATIHEATIHGNLIR